MPNPETVAAQLESYESLCGRLGELLIAGCYYGESRHQSLWTDCVERIASIPSPEAGYPLWTTLRSYPALILLYLGGIAAVVAGNYETLAALLLKPKFRIGDRELPFLEQVNPMHVLEPRNVQTLPGMERRKTPMSQYLEKHLRVPLQRLLPDDHTYLSTFDRFEYILALAYMDQSDRGWAPMGCFMWRYELRGGSPAEAIANEISKMGESWPLARAGMFGGSIERAKQTKTSLDDFIRRISQQLW